MNQILNVTTLMENTEGVPGCLAEHGLSLYIETAKHNILVDTGASAGILHNATVLGIDLKNVDIVVISHGHYDHTGGLLAFAKLNPEAKIYIQGTAVREYMSIREQGMAYIGMDKRIADLPQVVFLDGDYDIDEELHIFTNVTGRTLWPKGNLRLKCLEQGELIQDDFRHEQYLVITQGNQQTLISGCAHNGILNILERYEQLYQRLPDYVMSGFHMMKKADYDEEDEMLIRQTAERLKAMPTKFFTGHCTGEYPLTVLQEIMGHQVVAMHSGDRLL